MIQVKNLSKNYGEKKALDDISFEVKDGEILGFLGPNGAGKSTTMNILTGYISSSSGQVLINGTDIMEDPKKAKKNIGYLPEIPPLYIDMTVSAYLDFVFDLKKCKMSRTKHLQEIYDLVKIEDVKDRIIKNLSKGYKQRVGLAQALIGNPPVLILDEPTVGLDPKQIIEIRTLVKRLGKNHTVILSSHILSEIQAVCDRVIIINKGKIAADDTTDHLSETMTNDHKLLVQIEGPREEVYKAVRGIDGVTSVIADMNRGENIYDYEIEAKPGIDVRRPLNKLIADKGWYLLKLQANELTLEDVFLKIVMGETEDLRLTGSNVAQDKVLDDVSLSFKPDKKQIEQEVDEAKEKLRDVLKTIDAQRSVADNEKNNKGSNDKKGKSKNGGNK
ncbi:MAG: ATP-binding cassette domain-containing protein [Oscillospiraceae bacterium]|nr:ATP-binding cassette domain-containing protein [Oscillospiraceae bacterium]